jgi:sulfoxide reductase catalytic subunit YedY
MQTLSDPAMFPAQGEFYYPWPYTEGLTMAEATNDLSSIATGLYGKPIVPQNGAPLRLAVPWKYGFKHVKSIVSFSFSDKRPVTFWEKLADNEYGFWANINPQVPHPRWSQATEKPLGADERIPTQLYNGYGEFVADLYKDMKGEKLFM